MKHVTKRTKEAICFGYKTLELVLIIMNWVLDTEDEQRLTEIDEVV